MAYKTDQLHIYKKSQRLGMILEDIKKLISNTLQKKGKTH